LQATTFGTFLPSVLSLDGPVVLNGHWQSERYFADIAKTVREDFRARPPEGRLQSLAAQMADEDSVAMSFRRGDYLTVVPKEDLTTLAFYRKAHAFLEEKLGRTLRVYGFSDDHHWLEQNLDDLFPGAVQVSGKLSSNKYEDLFLHASARNQIIANSTFSWWAAWLCPHPDKVVIAPKRWVWNWAAPDVVPAAWFRV